VLEQGSTERILRTHFERHFGVTIELGMEFLGVEQVEGHVIARVKNYATGAEETIRAQYLVGTDGDRSVVRKSLGLNFVGSRHDETLMYGDATLEGLDDQVRTAASVVHRLTDRGCPVLVPVRTLTRQDVGGGARWSLRRMTDQACRLMFHRPGCKGSDR
jgi:2-polyprenyl-6-methoxyphenol hydroxylase-like FAD-dependent oxidoreductase